MRVGVVSAPALGRRWWAERGSGAFASGEPHPRLGDLHGRGGGALVRDRADECRSSRGAPGTPRGLGDFWAHMLVAEGAVDGAVDDVGVSEWDLAAVQVIVEEAGGRFSDFAGAARIDSGSAVTSNGLLHDELLGAVATRSP